jgi:hypothetical protein
MSSDIEIKDGIQHKTMWNIITNTFSSLYYDYENYNGFLRGANRPDIRIS